MTLGGAAQLAAAHCPNERTLNPAVCSYNRPTYAVAFPSKDVSEFLDFNESKLDNPDMETSTVRWSEYLISCQYACDLWRYDSHDCLISCWYEMRHIRQCLWYVNHILWYVKVWFPWQFVLLTYSTCRQLCRRCEWLSMSVKRRPSWQLHSSSAFYDQRSHAQLSLLLHEFQWLLNAFVVASSDSTIH